MAGDNGDKTDSGIIAIGRALKDLSARFSVIVHDIGESRFVAVLMPPPAEDTTIATLHTGWKTANLPVNGETYKCYISPVKNPKGVIALCTGFNSSPLRHVREITELNAKGYSVCAIALPFQDPAGKNMKGFFPEAEKMLEAFYFDPRSPLYTTFDKSLPRIVVDHSTAGLVFEKLMLEKPELRIGHRLSAVYHVNPLFDTAHSAERFNRFMSAFYSWYAPRHSSEIPQSTIWARLYMEFAENHYHDIPHTANPQISFGQTLRLRDTGRVYVAALEHGDLEPAQIRRVMVIGESDNSCCPKTGEYVGNILGAEVIKLKGAGHSMADHPELLEAVTDDLAGLRLDYDPAPETEPQPDNLELAY